MSAPQFVRAQLVLPVAEMARDRAWYADVLGFQTVFLNTDPDEDPDGNYAILRRDGAEVHLLLDESPREHPWTTAGTGYLFLIIRGVEALYEQLQSRDVPIARGLQRESWGALAFQWADPSGNLILVAEEFAG
jgi:catechol 2,3-dioxygenase-like lactoylglutathione lyase family enzyme